METALTMVKRWTDSQIITYFVTSFSFTINKHKHLKNENKTSCTQGDELP